MSQSNTALKMQSNTLSRQEMIMQHYPLVRKIAAGLSRRFPAHVEVDDLVQIGVLGLIEAIDRYRAEQFPSFETYARIRIQGAILDDRRAQDWTPRSVRDRAQLLQGTRERLTEKYGRTPTEAELASALNVSLRRLRKMVRGSEIRTVVSMEAGAEESLRIGDVIPDSKPSVQELMERSEEIQAVRLNIQTLSDKERSIIEMYYYQNRSFNSISREFGVSEARISQIHSSVKSKMHGRLKSFIRA